MSAFWQANAQRERRGRVQGGAGGRPLFRQPSNMRQLRATPHPGLILKKEDPILQKSFEPRLAWQATAAVRAFGGTRILLVLLAVKASLNLFDACGSYQRHRASPDPACLFDLDRLQLFL